MEIALGVKEWLVGYKVDLYGPQNVGLGSGNGLTFSRATLRLYIFTTYRRVRSRRVIKRGKDPKQQILKSYLLKLMLKVFHKKHKNLSLFNLTK